MKITKEEKSLYNFLNVMFTAFGKSTIRNTIVGRGNRCYFFTDGYIGIFEDKDRDTMVGGNYDFGKFYYDLRQSPNKTFILEEMEIEDSVFDETTENAILLANEFYNCQHFVCEFDKDYEFKLAKIAEETERWLKDSDIKYLDKFKNSIIFRYEDNIIVKASGLTKEDASNVTTVLVFVGEIHPNISDATQQKMNVEEPFTPLIDGTPTNLIETSLDDSEQGIIDMDIDETMDDDPFPDEMLDESFEDDLIDEESFDVMEDDKEMF